MHKVTEMVEEEAARAEAEPDEPDEEEEAEAEAAPESALSPEPEAVADPISDADIAKAQKAVAAQQKRLAAILGDAFVAHECLLCSGLGFVPMLPEVGTTFTLAETPEGIVFTVAGPNDLSGYQTAADKELCPECDGLGQVVTGSKVPNFQLAACSACAGAGWRIKPREVGGDAVTFPLAPNGPTQPQTVPPGMPHDQWGREWGHQWYGVAPEHVPAS